MNDFQVAKESADVIILDDNFSTIVTVAKWGRSVYINIQKFVQFQLTVNIVALAVNFYSACRTGEKKLLLLHSLHMYTISYTYSHKEMCFTTFRKCSTYSSPAPVGEYDNGHTWCSCTRNGAP